MRGQNNIFLWHWTDWHVENSSCFREQIDRIAAWGFKTILVFPGCSLYKFTDKKFHWALARASQLARKRHVRFWLLADPRQSSRYFISTTEEATQCLMTPVSDTGTGIARLLNTAEVQDGRFTIHIPFTDKHSCAHLQEKAVLFSFSGIERVFMFTAANGIIDSGSVLDITHCAYSFSNLARGVIEVSGDVACSPGTTTYVMAFPKFNTNLFDFAGRQSNDLVYAFANNVFDACTHLDGMIWTSDATAYGMIQHMIPVNLSIYNTFLSEYGYSLKDVLYALLLPLDNNLHITVRTDYFSMLENIVKESKQDFYSTMHAFFPDMDLISEYSIFKGAETECDRLPVFNPWNTGDIVSRYITCRSTPGPSILSSLVMSKSLSLFSKNNNTSLSLTPADNTSLLLRHTADLCSLFSVDLVFSKEQQAIYETEKSIHGTDLFGEINRKMATIAAITKKREPFADALFIFPTHTIMNLNNCSRHRAVQNTFSLIHNLTRKGIFIDAVSPGALRNVSVTERGLKLSNRLYTSVIYPYAEIVEHDIVHILQKIAAYGIPLVFIETAPAYTTRNDPVSHPQPSEGLPRHHETERIISMLPRPIASFPESCIGTVILLGDRTLFLAASAVPGETCSGEISYKEESLMAEGSGSIVLVQKMSGEPMVQIA